VDTTTSVAEQHAAVGRYYDDTVELYDELWGDHIHHGYWDAEEPEVDRHTAQQRTVRELAAFAGVTPGSSVLDAGCGVGGPAIYLAGELGCAVNGITLSGKQVTLATHKAAEAGVANRASFQVRDALDTGLPAESVDVVWALESLELMGDKRAFFTEAHRVLRPGGTLALTTWCVRAGELSAADARLLRGISDAYALPYILPLDEYDTICRATGFELVRAADWSARVRHTYDPNITLVRRLEQEKGLLMDLARQKGPGIFRFFHAIPLMRQAYDTGLLQYGAIRASRPGVTAAPGRSTSDSPDRPSGRD
jgi:tocopherol O-methyltransferase